MLPRNLHIEEINRFHDTMELIRKKIDETQDEDKKGELALIYFKMDKLWQKIDDFIEFKVKVKLDTLELPY
jgi:hypothetical protein